MANHTSETDELWAEYARTRDQKLRNKLVVHYSSLVRAIATKLSVGMPSSVERDDLISDGMFGLMKAIDKFDPGLGVKFEAYAITRIRGSMIDELRSEDWVPRSVRNKTKGIERAISELAIGLGRNPSDSEVAEHLQVDVQDLHAMRNEMSQSTPLGSLDEHEFERSDSMANPADLHVSAEIANALADAINSLDVRSKIILTLYYVENLTLAEIGEVLGVTESRVCQLQGKLLQSLGAGLSAA